ncbi:cytochrome d ubiquinol oxidase subunit II [bacterium]|nr:cytochrome d ubiquinol oxidase subunit II [bacterium]
MSVLQVIWFFLIGILLAGYAILDGFDLGVGFWYLFAKKKKERRILLNSIIPFWDGNEVWLLTGGGALFAAFPHVYATVFSGFYLALMLVLYSLIFRAVSIEFRNKDFSEPWTNFWDKAFAFGSIIPAFLFGVALGNILRGLPLDGGMNYTGTFFMLLNPYALLIGLLGLFMIATHGALYISIKTEEQLAEKAKNWAQKAWFIYLTLFILAVIATILTQPHLLENYKFAPILWIIPILELVEILMIGFFIKWGEIFKGFITSSFSILGLFALTGSGLFPYLVPELGKAGYGLTVMNASSSNLTLKVMFILALIFMPFVIGYTVWIYRIFRGKANENSFSY